MKEWFLRPFPCMVLGFNHAETLEFIGNSNKYEYLRSFVGPLSRKELLRALNDYKSYNGRLMREDRDITNHSNRDGWFMEHLRLNEHINLISQMDDDGLLPVPIPLDVVRLAEAIKEGNDCRFALHDALLENGYTLCAKHINSYMECKMSIPNREAIESGQQEVGKLCVGKGDIGVPYCVIVGCVIQCPYWMVLNVMPTFLNELGLKW